MTTLADAWADPDAYNLSYNFAMDKREDLLRTLLDGNERARRRALFLIRSGIKEHIEMYAMPKGGSKPLDEEED